MNRFEGVTKPLMWSMALLLGALAGCSGTDSILGAGGGVVIPGAPGAILPGGVCPAAAGPTIPTVTSSDPVNGNQSVTISTTGVAGGGKLITATFDLAVGTLNSSTINTTTFTLSQLDANGVVVVPAIPASVIYDAPTRVATLTTSSALLADTSYTGIITTGVMSAAGTPLACSYAWNFKTAAAPVPGAVNLGLAAPFAMAATAGLTNTPTTPITTINGDVVLTPTLTCNGTAVPGGTGSTGFGAVGVACGATTPDSTPVLTGNVIITGPAATAVKNDMNAAFLSITPPAGPPAAGSLGGATSIAAGTTLGEPTGAALVQGDNLFAPGLYQSISSILITGDLTLDGQGDPNASFIFQSSTTIGLEAGSAPPGPHSRIILINGAKASNVFWQAGSSATLGLYSEFQGNILATASITMETGATSCGRLFAGAWVGGTGAFVFDSNVVSVPGQPFLPPAGYSTTCE